MYKLWWEVLGVEQNASEEEIKSAYSQLIKENHADDNQERFMEIKDAYRTAMTIIRTRDKKRVVPFVESDYYKEYEDRKYTYEDYQQEDNDDFLNEEEIVEELIEEEIIEEEFKKEKVVNVDDFLKIHGDKKSKRNIQAELHETFNFMFRESVNSFKESDYKDEYKWMYLLEYLRINYKSLTKENIDLFFNKIKNIQFIDIPYSIRMSVIVKGLEEIIDQVHHDDIDIIQLKAIIFQASDYKQSKEAKRYLTDFKYKWELENYKKKQPILSFVFQILFYIVAFIVICLILDMFL